MGNFNLENYETVKSRKKRFYNDYKDGRIVVKIINTDYTNQALFCATIFRNKEDQKNNLAFSTGYAHELRDAEKKINKYGKEYESVNYTSWIENCEESAIGRALDNAGYSGNNKCSQEEMEKVDHAQESKAYEDNVISEKQAKRLFAIATKNDVSPNIIKAELINTYKIDSSTKILKKDYNNIISWIEKFNKAS